MDRCTRGLCDFEFDGETIARAAAENRLLNMEIEFSLRHQFSCRVTSKGEVMPCVGVTLSLGSIRRQPLQGIIANSPVLKTLP